MSAFGRPACLAALLGAGIFTGAVSADSAEINRSSTPEIATGPSSTASIKPGTVVPAAIRTAVVSVPEAVPEVLMAGEAEEDPSLFDEAGLDTWWRSYQSHGRDRHE